MSCLVDGNPNSKLCVVGMAPGREELRKGIPFVGASGNMLWGTLIKSGIDRSDCYVLNTIGEWPEGTDGNPTPAQYDLYWQAFDEALELFTGRAILLLGGAALWRCTGLSGVQGWRGYLIRRDETHLVVRTIQEEGSYKTNTKFHKKGDPKVIKRKQACKNPIPGNVEHLVCTWHPSAVMRSGMTPLPAFEVDCMRAARGAQGKLEIVSSEFARAPFPMHGPHDAVAFDIETTREWNAITDISLARGEQCWSGQWDHTSKYYSILELENLDSVKVAHNISFDFPRLKKQGVLIKGKLYDTMLAAQLLQPDLYKGLEPVASLYLDTYRWKHLADEDQRRYNALDAKRTLQLYTATRDGLRQTGQLKLFEETIMPAVGVLMEMTERGMKVDLAFKDEWVKSLQAQSRDQTAQWLSMYPHISPSSPHQLKKLLYGELGMNVKYSKHGGVSTDETSLLELRKLYPEHTVALNLLLDIRDSGKLLGTYADRAIGSDGCIHPGYLPGAKDLDTFGKGMAGTGRITAKEPNIQNQPQSARRLYVPHKKGNLLFECDWSQIEARIIAELSGDEKLKEACRNGLHEANMRLLGVDKTRAKNGFYGWCYGAGAPTLSKTFKGKGYDISIPECQKLLDGFNQGYRDVFAWREDIKTQVMTQCMLVNPFGRRRYFPGRNVPAGLDFLPQSTAADIMWASIVPVAREVEKQGGALLTVVHDSFLFEMPEGFEWTGVKNLLEREWPMVGKGFRVPIAMKIGRHNWGDMEEANEGL